MTAAAMVRLATLWQRRSRAGRTYFSGFIGDAQLLMFRAEEITRDTGEVIQTWRLLVQEREPRAAGQRGDRARREPTSEERHRASAAFQAPAPGDADPFYDDTEAAIRDLIGNGQ